MMRRLEDENLHENKGLRMDKDQHDGLALAGLCESTELRVNKGLHVAKGPQEEHRLVGPHKLKGFHMDCKEQNGLRADEGFHVIKHEEHGLVGREDNGLSVKEAGHVTKGQCKERGRVGRENAGQHVYRGLHKDQVPQDVGSHTGLVHQEGRKGSTTQLQCVSQDGGVTLTITTSDDSIDSWWVKRTK